MLFISLNLLNLKMTWTANLPQLKAQFRLMRNDHNNWRDAGKTVNNLGILLKYVVESALRLLQKQWGADWLTSIYLQIITNLKSVSRIFEQLLRVCKCRSANCAEVSYQTRQMLEMSYVWNVQIINCFLELTFINRLSWLCRRPQNLLGCRWSTFSSACVIFNQI